MASTTLLLGCGGGADHGVALVPVSGKVTQAGSPLAGADVRFYATDPALLGSGVPVPKAKTETDGSFDLRTFDPGDGAPEGEYVVTVRLLEEVEAPDGQLVELDRLEGKYAQPNSAPATVQVAAGMDDVVVDLP